MLGSGFDFPVMLHVLVHLVFDATLVAVCCHCTHVNYFMLCGGARGGGGRVEQKAVVSLNLKKSSNGDVIHELKKRRPFRIAVECEI